jgi:hypothetical protein
MLESVEILIGFISLLMASVESSPWHSSIEQPYDYLMRKTSPSSRPLV